MSVAFDRVADTLSALSHEYDHDIVGEPSLLREIREALDLADDDEARQVLNALEETALLGMFGSGVSPVRIAIAMALATGERVGFARGMSTAGVQ